MEQDRKPDAQGIPTLPSWGDLQAMKAQYERLERIGTLFGMPVFVGPVAEGRTWRLSIPHLEMKEVTE